MNFPSQIFFNDINHGYRAAILKKNSLWLLPFYMVVATYFYYEKVRRTMRTVIISNLLKHLLLRKTDIRKTCRKTKFLGKKIWRNALALKSKKVQGIIYVYFGIIIFNCLSSPNSCLKFPLNSFFGGIKGFYQSFLGNEVDFRDIMNVSPNILAKN